VTGWQPAINHGIFRESPVTPDLSSVRGSSDASKAADKEMYAQNAAMLDTLMDTTFQLNANTTPLLMVGGRLRPLTEATYATELMAFEATCNSHGLRHPIIKHMIDCATSNRLPINGVQTTQQAVTMYSQWGRLIKTDFDTNNIPSLDQASSMFEVLGTMRTLAATLNSMQITAETREAAHKVKEGKLLAEVRILRGQITAIPGLLKDLTGKMLSPLQHRKRSRVQPLEDAGDLLEEGVSGLGGASRACHSSQAHSLDANYGSSVHSVASPDSAVMSLEGAGLFGQPSASASAPSASASTPSASASRPPASTSRPPASGLRPTESRTASVMPTSAAASASSTSTSAPPPPTNVHAALRHCDNNREVMVINKSLLAHQIFKDFFEKRFHKRLKLETEAAGTDQDKCRIRIVINCLYNETTEAEKILLSTIPKEGEDITILAAQLQTKFLTSLSGAEERAFDKSPHRLTDQNATANAIESRLKRITGQEGGAVLVKALKYKDDFKHIIFTR
jgi:hypothetical protein